MNASELRKRVLLQPEFLAQTLAIVWASVVAIITLFAYLLNEDILLTKIFEAIYPFYDISVLGIILGFIWGWINGFIQGFLIGWLYKLLVNTERSSLILPGLSDSPVTVLRHGSGDPPFTIVFVANPQIIQFQNPPTSTVHLKPDPIMQDRALFSVTVRRCFQAFKSNELLGLPEIFNRFRLIAIFDEARSADNPDFALCQEYRSSDMLAPRKDTAKIRDYVEDRVPDLSTNGRRNDIDMIYVISASNTQTRSAARFAEESPPGGAAISGEPFQLRFREDEGGFHPLHDSKVHAHFSRVPGVVALSALDDRLKTTVHEFAHAFSSRDNGILDDEYMDLTQRGMPFKINKKTRTPYQLDDDAIAGLESELDEHDDRLVPVTIMDELKAGSLNTMPTIGDATFLYKVMDAFSNASDVDKYGYLILKHCDQTRYRLADHSLDELELTGLPLEIINGDGTIRGLATLRGTEFRGTERFKQSLRTAITEPNVNLYENLILRVAKLRSDPIPPNFTEYEFDHIMLNYASDRSRPDKERHWTSYVAETFGALDVCTLDRTASANRYDRLIFDFMYDRLLTKINRT